MKILISTLILSSYMSQVNLEKIDEGFYKNKELHDPASDGR